VNNPFQSLVKIDGRPEKLGVAEQISAWANFSLTIRIFVVSTTLETKDNQHWMEP